MFRYYFLKKILISVIFGGFFFKAAFAENNLVIEVAGEASGIIEISLLPDLAPLHVERIKALAYDGSYDGVVFHRVIDGFMAQTGDVEFGNSSNDAFNMSRAGTGGSSLPNIEAEFSDVNHGRGAVSMARAQDPNSANSQFFICFQPAPFLAVSYTHLRAHET